ncbi:phage tail assembly protein [Methyloceanibacter methanicus]|uniref:phage tail assembly protein n=1 Tax=Methyloceanibacter methanicus TaxID=1774968 RepID=UPI003CC7AD44
MVKLSRPLELHGGPIMEIKLREPTFSDYLEHGDLYVGSQTADGSLSFKVDRLALMNWAVALSDISALDLGELGMKDVTTLTKVISELVGGEGN